MWPFLSCKSEKGDFHDHCWHTEPRKEFYIGCAKGTFRNTEKRICCRCGKDGGEVTYYAY